MFRRLLQGGRRKIGQDHLESIYWGLQPYEDHYKTFGLNVDFRKLAPPELVTQLFALSDHIETTVHLVRVLHQRQVAEGMLEKIDVKPAREEVGLLAANEAAERQYESAKGFCDEIMTLAESGRISSDPKVGRFLEENLTIILASYARYSLKF